MTGYVENNTIKSLRPRKNSKFHQGFVDPKKLKKYADSFKDEPIIFRSGLELEVIYYFETNPNVVKWVSEPIGIPYYNRLLGHKQNYYIDYIIESASGQKCLVEVKPYNQTKKPKDTDSVWAKKTWITNIDKWAAAKKFADEHNMKFIIITEKTLEEA